MWHGPCKKRRWNSCLCPAWLVMTVYTYLEPELHTPVLSLAFAKIVCKRARIAALQSGGGRTQTTGKQSFINFTADEALYHQCVPLCTWALRHCFFPTALSVPDCSTVHLEAVTFLVLSFNITKSEWPNFLAHKGIQHYKAIPQLPWLINNSVHK